MRSRVPGSLDQLYEPAWFDDPYAAPGTAGKVPGIAGDDKGRSTFSGRSEEHVIIGVDADPFHFCRIDMDHVVTREPQVRQDGVNITKR